MKLIKTCSNQTINFMVKSNCVLKVYTFLELKVIEMFSITKKLAPHVVIKTNVKNILILQCQVERNWFVNYKIQ